MRRATRPTPLLPDAIRLNPHKIALAPAFFRRHRVRCGRRSNNRWRDFIGSIAGGNPTGVLQVSSIARIIVFFWNSTTPLLCPHWADSQIFEMQPMNHQNYYPHQPRLHTVTIPQPNYLRMPRL